MTSKEWKKIIINYTVLNWHKKNNRTYKGDQRNIPKELGKLAQKEF